MAIVKMEKVELLVHRSVVTPVLRSVQKVGLVEFAEVETPLSVNEPEKHVFEFNYVSSRLDYAVNFLSLFDEKKSGLRHVIEGDKILTSEEELEHTISNYYYNDTIDALQNLEEKINDNEAKLSSLKEERVLLDNWTALNMPLGEGLSTQKTQTLLFFGEEACISALVEDLKKSTLTYIIALKELTTLAITTLKESASDIEAIVAKYKLDEIILPRRRGTPVEEIERIGRAIIKTQSQKESLENEVRSFLPELPKLRMASDYIFWKKEKHNLASKAPSTDTVLLFEGWCPVEKISELKSNIQKETDLFSLKQIPLKEDEAPPVEIENNFAIRPFEAITRLYGLPGAKDLDPTPFLAGFFFIFFGLSLTDVGYGLLLFLVTASILFFYRVPKGAKPLVSLIMLGGLSSFLIGLLFGGYLGIDTSLLPAWTQKIQQFNPIENPLPVFYLALGFGVLQIMFGIILSIVREAKNTTLAEGLLDHGPWLALFLTLILWGGNTLDFIPGNPMFFVWGIYGALISLVLTQGRKEKTLVKKGLMGILSLYNSINYFSDVLSYSRLLALGLATSALAFAVNLIAGMVSGVPVVGGLLMVAILIVGHLFNLAVNLLGAFIHSARLQFVEFFGKFITGNGRNFMPFVRKERFITLK